MFFFVEFLTFLVQFGATRPPNYGKVLPVFPQLFPRKLGEHTVQHIGQILLQRFAPNRWVKNTCKNYCFFFNNFGIARLKDEPQGPFPKGRGRR